MPSISSALVIGGGIAGPVTATALRLAGIDAHVVEAYPDADSGAGGSLALAANGQTALDVLGLGEAVRAIGIPIAHSRMTVGTKDLGALPSIAGVEPMRMVRRGQLQRVLHDGAVRAGATYSYGRRLVRVEETASGVTAIFDDGGTESADVIIGADGARSTIRSIIDPAAPGPHYTGLLSFEGRADAGLPGARAQGAQADFDGMTFAFGSRAYYLYWPEPDDTIVWGANLPSTAYLSLTDARRTSNEEWLRVLRATYAGDRPGERLVESTTAEGLDATGAIHIMPSVPNWHRDRLVLVGDAVHAPSNSTGQGASLAIESAIELARALRDAADPTSAFAAYERARRPRVEAITRRGARVNSTKNPGPMAQRMMGVVMPLMMRFMDFEKTMGPEQRVRIDWEQPFPLGSR